MVKTKVTSIRLNSDLLEKVSAFGLNVSRVCEFALQNEINKLILNENVVPKGTVGISKNSRIIMANKKFKNIKRIKVGDKVLSHNILTDRFEDANVIDVGPLTPEKTFTTSITIVNTAGTEIEVLPGTKIFCRPETFSEVDWIPAKDIRHGFLVSTASPKSSIGGSRIVNVNENHIHDFFFRLEVYPNNCFFANSNIRRKLHYMNDYMSSVWTFPVKGYLGQIGILLEQDIIHPK